MTQKRKPASAKGPLAIFAAPLLLAAISVVGLLSALLGDGVWDAVSWFTLAAPVAVIAWMLYRR